MTFADLIFIPSALFVFILIGSILVTAYTRGLRAAAKPAITLAAFLAIYAIAFVAAALIMPRRYFAPGERRCFDDWCVTALTAHPSGPNWIANIQISSDAKRVAQRAPGTWIELEDFNGRRYKPISEPDHPIASEILPGESFPVSLTYRIPENTKPAGILVHHGEGPLRIEIGNDGSFLYKRTLLRLQIE